MISFFVGVRSAGEFVRDYGLLRRQDWSRGGDWVLWGGFWLLGVFVGDIQYRGDCVMDRVFIVIVGVVDIFIM